MECGICVNALNKTTHKPIACPLCNAQTCIQCVKRYLLGSNDDPSCMHCRKPWELYDLLPKSWIDGDYKAHRQAVLMDRERSRLPETQLLAEAATIRDAHVDTYRKLTADYNELKERLARLNLQRSSSSRTTVVLNRLLDNPEVPAGLDLQAYLATGLLEAKTAARTFMQACPNEGCRGFLNNQWHCSMCKMWSCKDCHEVKGDHRDAPHECDPDIRASAQAIAQETRNCPKCAVPIFRISGCNQMWCTACHTSFDWASGDIIRGGWFHNPHLAEWQARHGGVHARPNGNCPQFPEGWKVRTVLQAVLSDSEPLCRNLDSAYFYVNRLMDERPVDLQQKYDLARRNARIEFMRKKIDEDAWKAKLVRLEKDFNKKRELLQVVLMFIEGMQYIFTRVIRGTFTLRGVFVRTDVKRQELQAAYDEMQELRDFANARLTTVCKRLGHVVRQLRWEEV